MAGCALVALLNSPAWAQRQRDSLTNPEVDQLRDTALEPDLRVKLYVKFARARLASLEPAQSDSKTTDRGKETHDRLQEFLDVYDEMNENIDTYVGRKSDLRKVLKTVIEADTEFQAKLRMISYRGIAEKATVSIGAVWIPHDCFLTEREIEDRANRAKNFAKKNGKNCIATYKGEYYSESELVIVK